jgi:hypothetical protein
MKYECTQYYCNIMFSHLQSSSVISSFTRKPIGLCPPHLMTRQRPKHRQSGSSPVCEARIASYLSYRHLNSIRSKASSVWQRPRVHRYSNKSLTTSTENSGLSTYCTHVLHFAQETNTIIQCIRATNNHEISCYGTRRFIPVTQASQ